MIICYDPATGMVSNVITTYSKGLPAAYTEAGLPFLHINLVPQDGEELPSPMRSAIEVCRSCYVADGALVDRPTFDVASELSLQADGADEVVIGGLPIPCDITVDGEPHTLTDGELRLTADMPAEYRIELVQWPFQPKTVKVTAHAPE